MKRRNHLPWLTINLNFCIVARLPLTRYIPSTSRPENKRACFIFAHKRTETVKEKKKCGKEGSSKSTPNIPSSQRRQISLNQAIFNNSNSTN